MDCLNAREMADKAAERVSARESVAGLLLLSVLEHKDTPRVGEMVGVM